MSCCANHYHATSEGDRGFEVDATRIRFGRGLLDEVGGAARALGMTRVALFTDKSVRGLAFFATVRESLLEAGIDTVIYDEVSVEPTDESFKAAAAFAVDGKFDGYVSVGGGSTIDTAKAANLYATYPADFMAYVNAPIGGGQAVPGPLKPHIACPTTSGTGSECTGIAIFDLVAMGAKTGIVSRRLKPSLGIADPNVTRTLPGEVVACSGFDVLSHALESYTALPFTRRKRPVNGEARPLSQGANPFSDIACTEALKLLGRYIERAVKDAADDEAREQMMFAATLAGIGFGNAGCHAPHGMSYSVSGLVRDFRPQGYPQDDAIVPHGMSVIVNAPAVFEFTAAACPGRHIEAASLLGGDVRDVDDRDAGHALSSRIVELMRSTNMPNGLEALGYTAADVDALTDGAFPQRRLLTNSPREISRDDLRGLFESAMAYW
ncbi:MAG TPA: hydroxyacid-oxoacid transhydrogenase [Candidatus Dormibacteraeota bacterium]|nr:hydroxyacid-oxoacid transhydrogenase [Candidatus Dormibacteraeota bacterium]